MGVFGLTLPRRAAGLIGAGGFRDEDRVIYGIGAQKGGTTWVFDQLRKHPEVHVNEPKEVHYWDTIHPPHLPYYTKKAREDLAETAVKPFLRRVRNQGLRIAAWHHRRARAYDRLLNDPDPQHQRYAAFLTSGAGEKRVLGDISPGYAMMDRDGFAEMDAAVPDARFVFIMRDPVDRLWSNIRHNRARGFRGDPATVDPQERFEHALDNPDSGPMVRSDYARTIEELEAAVPRERIGYFFFETLFTDKEIARLSEFLGIAPIAARFDKKVNPGSDGGTRPRADLARRARKQLNHVYNMAEERFGDALPHAWRHT